jgi:hypothetical protein
VTQRRAAFARRQRLEIDLGIISNLKVYRTVCRPLTPENGPKASAAVWGRLRAACCRTHPRRVEDGVHPGPLSRTLVSPPLKAGKPLFQRGDGGPKIVSTHRERCSEARIRCNVVIEKLGPSIEIFDECTDTGHFPQRYDIRTPKMTPMFHSWYPECSDLRQARGLVPSLGKDRATTASLRAGPYYLPPCAIRFLLVAAKKMKGRLNTGAGGPSRSWGGGDVVASTKAIEAMPTEKTIAIIPTDAEIDCANLNEIQTISNAVLRGGVGGALTPKEGNEIRRRIGKRLQAIEEELRRGYRADSGRYEPHRRRRRSL